MLKSTLSFFASEILQGPPQPPYNGKFLVADHHYKWESLIQKHERLCILAPRDHGKCQREGALVLAADGRRIPIEEWRGGDVLAYNPLTHDFELAHTPPSQPNGVKPVLRVQTRTGRVVEVTENHPLRLWDRWVDADKLQVGDRIGVPRELPVETLDAPEVEHPWLLGLVTGDGGTTGSSVCVTTADAGVVEALRETPWEVVPRDQYTYALSNNWKRDGSAQNWARKYGLMGKGGAHKRVPEALFQAPRHNICEYLAGYFDSDGCVNPHGGGALEYYSISEGLLRDVQHLLLRIGVVAVLSPKVGRYKDRRHESWRLTIRGRDILQFAKHVELRSNREGQLSELVRAQEGKDLSSGGAVDRFDPAVWHRLEKSEHWFRQNGLPRPTKRYSPTRDKVRRVAEAEGNTQLKALAASPVMWDEVVSVEPIGEHMTWSMYVPGLVNYVADDVIHHNTFLFSFAYPIWNVYSPPGVERETKGFIFSASQPQAERILGDIKTELETNPLLQHLVPKRKVLWSATTILLANGARIDARGYGTKVRGFHPDWIVVDDGLNDEDAYSETIRNRHIDYFYNAITQMLVPQGQMIVVGTPFHPLDLYGSLGHNEKYHFERFQALDEKTGEALWSDRYSKEVLESKRTEIGAIRFTRELLCNPVGDDMSLFPTSLFKGSPREQLQIKLGMPLEFWKNAGVQLFMGVDFALSSNIRADYTVIWIMGVDGHGNRWIVDVHRDRGLPYHVQESLMNDYGKKYDVSLAFLEANQAQQIFGTELIRKTDIPIKLFHTGAQKNNLEKGVPSLRILLENGKIRIPRGDKRSIEVMDEWIAEMQGFTYVDGKIVSVSAHDDMGMAFWICDQACRQGGFSFSFEGEEEDDVKDLDQFLLEQTADPEEQIQEMAADYDKVGGLDREAYNKLIGDPDDLNDGPLRGAPSADLVKTWYG